MTYSINIINHECCHLIQQDSEGKEIIQDITLKTFFEKAQELGFFPEGHDFEDHECDITFDFYGLDRTMTREYSAMLEADCFGTEDLETIIKSFFDTFPERVYWIKCNNIEVLHRTPERDCDGSKWRFYVTANGEQSRHIYMSFLDTEWSEYQTNQKTALEMLLKQLEGQVLVVKNRIESL